jgi:uncharacterized protein with FMN-binding domain
MVTPMPPARFDRGARRIALWGLTTVSTVVLLFSYRTSTSSTMPVAAGTPTTTTTAATSTAGTSASTATTTAKAASSYSGTVTGTAADTRWGPVQVRVTLATGKITAVDVIQEPDSNGRDQQINADAVPQLVSETLQAQSTQIDMVSGATYTSEGYTQSLQSALDQAGVA